MRRKQTQTLAKKIYFLSYFCFDFSFLVYLKRKKKMKQIQTQTQTPQPRMRKGVNLMFVSSESSRKIEIVAISCFLNI